jgi:hypothetical protein
VKNSSKIAEDMLEEKTYETGILQEFRSKYRQTGDFT